MLNIIEYGKDEYDFPCIIVLGCFDALHKGHCELLKQARFQARINGLDLGVMMFSEGKGGKLVYTFDERLELLNKFNVKFVLKIDYTDEFKKIPAADFLKTIEQKINVKGYMSGKDFRFGAGAKGKSSTLKAYADNEDNGVWYQAVKDVMYGENKISTSFIKELLETGYIDIADELLTRNYSVTGIVARGAGRGRELLGFPTMNIEYPQTKVSVKAGVYAVVCKIGDVAYKGIANYGGRPTFGENDPMLEVHLDGYDGENYGSEVKVEFTEYIREIQKFETAEELAAQLNTDILKIR